MILNYLAAFSLLFGCWLALMAFSMDGIIFGALVSGASAYFMTRHMSTTGAPLLHRLPGFLFYFVRESIVGGIQVAVMSFEKNPPKPYLLERELRLHGDFARFFFIAGISLVPGTLSYNLRQAHLTVHVLDVRFDADSELDVMERKIAHLFGQTID